MMDIYSIAWIANKLPWLIYSIMTLILLLAGGFVTRYLWLSVVYVILAGLMTLRSDWQKQQDDVAKHRRLNELAIIQTRQRWIASQRQELVGKWHDSEVEIEVIK